MPDITASPSLARPRRIANLSGALLFLTSVHHIYGGYVYHTPWRYHVVPVAAFVAAILFGSLALMGKPMMRKAAMFFFVASALFSLGFYGVFEGFYNHVVKDVLYFAGASSSLMQRLFPPPTYEMPNDVVFELTGVLQALPPALALRVKR